MHNLSDKDLDHLSKEAAEKYEAAPSPVLWNKLQQRLDAEMPVEKKDKRRVFWLLSLAGLLFLSVMMGINVMDKKEHQENVNLAADAVLNIIKTTDQATTEKNINKNAIKPISVTNDLQRSDLTLKKEISAEIVSVTPKKKEQKSKHPLLKSQKSDPTEAPYIKPGSLTSMNFEQKQSINENVPQKTLAEQAGQTEKKELTPTQQSFEEFLQDEQSAIITASAATDSVLIATDKKQSDMSTANSTSNQKNKLRRVNRWELSAVFGPDFSNVGFVSPEKTGMNIGLMVGYRITDRVSVQTGILYSRKYYTAVGDAYNRFPAYNMNNTYLKMKWVEAYSFMWDVPINIRYDFILRKKQRAFVSAGLSSYILNKEDLQYYFTYYGDPGYRAWINPENSSYWMSAFNLSAGYEQRISKTFSIQAEPFLKIPTGEIGYGNINLNSLGMFLSLKYSPAPNLFKIKKTR